MLSLLADIICTITEAEKPSGYDKDVEIKEDVLDWYECDFTFSGYDR